MMFVVLFICYLPVLCAGLYEDQVGLSDWHVKNIGQIQHGGFYGNFGIFGTKQGVISAINAEKGGDLEWRTVFRKNGGNEFSSGGFLAVDVEKNIFITISNDGCTARSFIASSGMMSWDIQICDSGVGVGGGMLDFDIDGDGSFDVIIVEEKFVQILSGQNGVLLWKYTQEQDDDIITGYSISGSYCFIRTKNNKLIQLDLKNKKSVVLESEIDNNNVLGQCDRFLYYSNEKQLKVFDLKNRKELTLNDNIPISSSSSSIFTVLEKGGFLKIDSNYYKINEKTGQLSKTFENIHFASSNSDGEIVGIEQSSDETLEACGPISSMIWKNEKFDFPEKHGQRGERGYVVNMFTQVKTKNILRAVVLFQDDSIVCIEYNSKTKKSNTLYTREEALASIIETDSIELPPVSVDGSYDSKVADEIAHLLSHGFSVSSFLFRLQDQAKTIQGFFLSIFKTMFGYIQQIVDSQGEALIKLFKGESLGGNQGYSDVELSSFGFRRGLLFLTESGKVFCIDSMTGSILWSLFDESYGGKTNTKMFVTHAREAGASHPAQVAFVSLKNGNAIWRNAMNGKMLSQYKRVEGPLIQVILVPPLKTKTDDDDVIEPNIILGIDSNFNCHTYPKNKDSVELEEMKKKMYFAYYDETNRVLNGYGFSKKNKNKVEINWSFVIPENQKLVKLQGHAGGEISNPGITLGDGSVLVKFISPHLFLVVTINSQQELLASIIDGVSGKVYKRFSHKNGASPVQAVIYDNMVIYSFWNTAQNRVEVSSVGLYEGAIDKRGLNLWTPRTEGMVGSGGSFSSFDSTTSTSVLQRTYFVDNEINAFGVSKSRFGIASRNVLIGLGNGGVNMMYPKFLDPRRPTGKLTKNEELEGLVSYSPQLPIIPTLTITYNQTIERIQKIDTIATKLESTSLTVVTGLDIFYTRIMPSKGFDLLDEDFNFTLLMLLTAALTIAVTVLSKMVKENQLASAWK